MGYAVARYFTADLEYVARQESLKVVLYGFLFFAILNNLHRQETTAIVATVLIVVATAIAGYALYQFITGSDRVWHFIRPPGYAGRGSGTYICPNHLGGYLEILLPLAIAYTLTGRFSPLQRILLAYASLVILAGIAASVSRGTWIATGRLPPVTAGIPSPPAGLQTGGPEHSGPAAGGWLSGPQTRGPVQKSQRSPGEP
jgi:hypothetical protein